MQETVETDVEAGGLGTWWDQSRIPTPFFPLKHIWLCIPQELRRVLGTWGLVVPGGTTLPSALPPTHPSPLSDPETDRESSQSRTLQLPTSIAWLVGGDLPLVCSGTSWNADSIALFGWNDTESSTFCLPPSCLFPVRVHHCECFPRCRTFRGSAGVTVSSPQLS